MARRRSGLQPLHLAGAVAFLAVAGGAYWYFTRDKGSKLQGNPFSGSQYVQNKIVRGNTYLITGTVAKQLRFNGDSDRLFSVDVKDDGTSEVVPVPVKVPSKFSTVNMQVGQEFQMLVLVDQAGVLVVQEIRKS